MLNKFIYIFLKAFLAGIMISIGACSYLVIENRYIGSMLFTIGLYTIYTFDFYLYTGKIGYICQDKNFLKILFIWVGNFVGGFLSAKALSVTRLSEKLQEKASLYSDIKLNDNLVSAFVLAIFCGIMMYIAAESFKKTQNTQNSIGGYIGLFLCVMLFLLLGFEHSIANIFYFSVANAWSLKALIALLIVTLGNAVGAILFPVLQIFISKLAKN